MSVFQYGMPLMAEIEPGGDLLPEDLPCALDVAATSVTAALRCWPAQAERVRMKTAFCRRFRPLALINAGGGHQRVRVGHPCAGPSAVAQVADLAPVAAQLRLRWRRATSRRTRA